ncbi:MAG: endonuclease [Muribaculaceae bacterium]|nr:endonuclease [Muribaculaceae bacterium]
MKKRHLLTALLTLLASAAALAEIPAGYYTPIDGKKDAELKKAVYLVIHNLTRISSYSALPSYFQHTDVYPNSSRWWDMYSDIPLYAPSFSGLNREHSFPKSWWGGSTNVNAYTDLNHLYPSEARANMAKSNYPLGEVDTRYTVDFDNGITRVGYAVAGQGGGAKFVFEPDDEYKGDFARTYFYMVTCYQDYTWEPKYMWMLQQNEYPTLSDWAIKLLLRWSREDPVSQKEIDRNEQVYRYQNNRNPFIDFPSLAEYIWGTHKGEAFSLKNAGGIEPVGDPTLITPVQDMALDFGEVAIGSSTTAQLFFKGESLTNSLTIRIYSGDKDMFRASVSAIPAASVNSEEGYWLTVTYTPTAIGNHQSRLLISDGGLTGSRGVNMVASCQPVPTLNACTALPASNITDDSYLASWTVPDGEVVDYFIVTRTRYVGGQQLVEQIEAEGTEVAIDGFGQSDSESYSVRSYRLGYTSPESNVVFVSHSGITGVEADEPIAVSAAEGGLLIECSAPQTGCRVLDPSGRLVASLPQIGSETVVPLGPGVYFVVTDQCRRPARIIIY